MEEWQKSEQTFSQLTQSNQQQNLRPLQLICDWIWSQNNFPNTGF